MTLDCVRPSLVSYRSFTVMLVWSVFSILPKCLFVIIVIYAYLIDISQGSVEMHLRCGGICSNHIIANVCRVCQWKNFENWSIIGEVMDKSKVPLFFGPSCMVQIMSTNNSVICVSYTRYMSLFVSILLLLFLSLWLCWLMWTCSWRIWSRAKCLNCSRWNSETGTSWWIHCFAGVPMYVSCTPYVLFFGDFVHFLRHWTIWHLHTWSTIATWSATTLADYVQPPLSFVLYQEQGHGSVTDHSPSPAHESGTVRGLRTVQSATKDTFV